MNDLVYKARLSFFMSSSHIECLKIILYIRGCLKNRLFQRPRNRRKPLRRKGSSVFLNRDPEGILLLKLLPLFNDHSPPSPRYSAYSWAPVPSLSDPPTAHPVTVIAKSLSVSSAKSASVATTWSILFNSAVSPGFIGLGSSSQPKRMVALAIPDNFLIARAIDHILPVSCFE